MASVRPVPLAVMEHQVERGERTKKVGRRQGKQIIRLEAVVARSKVCQSPRPASHAPFARRRLVPSPVHSPAINACEFRPV